MEALAGENFNQAVLRVQGTLEGKPGYVTEDLVFNGISVRVSNKSDLSDLAIIYNLRYEIRRLKAGYNDWAQSWHAGSTRS